MTHIKHLPMQLHTLKSRNFYLLCCDWFKFLKYQQKLKVTSHQPRTSFPADCFTKVRSCSKKTFQAMQSCRQLSNLGMMIVIDCLFIFLSSFLKSKIQHPQYPSNSSSAVCIILHIITNFYRLSKLNDMSVTVRSDKYKLLR